MLTIIGIDPGKRGGMAIIRYDDEGYLVRTLVFPTDKTDTERRAYALNKITDVDPNPHVFIEDVHSMPKQGVRSMFTFGQEMGLWLGLLAGSGLTSVKVAPQKWQAITKGMAGRTTKERAIRFAMVAFPEVKLILPGCRKPHDGIADALCIAYYGYKLLMREAQSHGTNN